MWNAQPGESLLFYAPFNVGIDLCNSSFLNEITYPLQIETSRECRFDVLLIEARSCLSFNAKKPSLKSLCVLPGYMYARSNTIYHIYLSICQCVPKRGEALLMATST